MQPMQRNLIDPLTEYFTAQAAKASSINSKANTPKLFIAALKASGSVTGLAVGQVQSAFAEGWGHTVQPAPLVVIF